MVTDKTDMQDAGSQGDVKGPVTSRQLALMAAAAADAKKATDIVIQDVSQLVKVTDYFICVTAQNRPQVEAVMEGVETALRQKAGRHPLSIEGTEDTRWVLLDYGEVVIHIFLPEVRDFYRLETLWGDAPIVDVAEAGITDPVYSERIGRLVHGEGASR